MQYLIRGFFVNVDRIINPQNMTSIPILYLPFYQPAKAEAENLIYYQGEFKKA
jgi:hypothetical protein